jgi:hypothetical protein
VFAAVAPDGCVVRPTAASCPRLTTGIRSPARSGHGPRPDGVYAIVSAASSTSTGMPLNCTDSIIGMHKATHQ